MRIRFTTVHMVFSPVVRVTPEGGKYVEYGDGMGFMANSFPVSDQGGFWEYGMTNKHIRKLLTNSDHDFKKGDGVSIGMKDAPEYKITEIEKYSDHTEIVLEEL